MNELRERLLAFLKDVPNGDAMPQNGLLKPQLRRLGSYHLCEEVYIEDKGRKFILWMRLKGQPKLYYVAKREEPNQPRLFETIDTIWNIVNTNFPYIEQAVFFRTSPFAMRQPKVIGKSLRDRLSNTAESKKAEK